MMKKLLSKTFFKTYYKVKGTSNRTLTKTEMMKRHARTQGIPLVRLKHENVENFDVTGMPKLRK